MWSSPCDRGVRWPDRPPESQWLKELAPEPMLNFVRHQLSDRKLRLLACSFGRDLSGDAIAQSLVREFTTAAAVFSRLSARCRIPDIIRKAPSPGVRIPTASGGQPWGCDMSFIQCALFTPDMAVDHPDVRTFRSIIEVRCKPYNARITRFAVDRGVISLEISNDGVMHELLAELNAKGFHAKFFKDGVSEASFFLDDGHQRPKP